MATTRPYGTWPSPIGADALLQGVVGLGNPRVFDGELYWMESRPAEAGRTVVMRRRRDGSLQACMPKPFNARSRVHEYGGICYAVLDGVLLFTHFVDQRVYAVQLDEPDAQPRAVTPPDGRRWADFEVDPHRRRLIAVGEEDREGSEPRNFIAAVDLTAPAGAAAVIELAAGHDFYAAPRLSPDGRELVWLDWDHPCMPWDGTRLRRAQLDAEGVPEGAEHVAGSDGESIFQPEWDGAGRLWFVSDRTGWWNLYRREGADDLAVAPQPAEFGLPLWQFGMRTYLPLDGGRVACTWRDGAGEHLGVLTHAGELETIEVPDTGIGGLAWDGERLAFVGAAPTRFPELVRLDPADGAREVIRRAAELELAEADLATPEPVTFATGDDELAHAFLYRPAHRDCRGPDGERPPLLVISHGGPTAATSPVLSLKIQFWTSRGFAVLDVNYRGSTGFGRTYRDRLKGGWGAVDVEDCVAGARAMVERGEADPARLAIRGSSAGGLTVLGALTFHDVFAAGASLYGVADLEALARDTHKFEARYLDTLVGPLPEAIDVYRARSPIHHVDRLACPVIFLQGLEDRIVPPSQAEAMVSALDAKGLPVAYVTFPEEQHGFRQAENIRRALEAELYFYGRVLGFTPADEIEPVPIRNLDGATGGE